MDMETAVQSLTDTVLAIPDAEDLILPVAASVAVAMVSSVVMYRMRSHKHESRALSAYNPLVALGSVSALAFMVLFTMKSMGIFDRPPFTAVSSFLHHPGAVGVTLFAVAAAPLIEDLRHQQLRN